ncbi:hypothetical protein DPMN_055019 [Dreissena polymorpha]|uniref:Uncharacterized protein n=1 Tax=Dreissena polymorpha TaxID=45954 RepID=A0A9D4HS49_DREPO|nr:hypothetical protein DPMN_055019 [Dreissena polymorpha]
MQSLLHVMVMMKVNHAWNKSVWVKNSVPTVEEKLTKTNLSWGIVRNVVKTAQLRARCAWNVYKLMPQLSNFACPFECNSFDTYMRKVDLNTKLNRTPTPTPTQTPTPR